jgi:threonine dehydrogenase-like Zn-dependent dehydrogenase
LNIGGTSIWVGAVYTQPPVMINAEKIVRNLLTIKGLHNYRPEDLATAVRFVAENYRRYPFEKLVSTEFPLRELDQAFQLADQRNDYRIGIYPE